MQMPCPPCGIQGRVEGQTFCWCAISSIAALFYALFSIRLLPAAAPIQWHLFPRSAVKQWEGPRFVERMDVGLTSGYKSTWY